jgi:predicted phage replisome organizer
MSNKDKKYYWLKLHRDFFKRHDIKIIESMENGKDYLLFYLKLLLESVDHEGLLRFSDTIPYEDKMLAVITNTNIDIVKTAMELFIQLGIIEIFDDRTIYMSEVQKMLGAETYWAERKRIQRGKLTTQGLKALESNDKTLSTMSRQELETEQEIEKEIELEAKNKYGEYVLLSKSEYATLVDKHGEKQTIEMIEILDNYKGSSGKKYKSDYRAILSWVIDRWNKDKGKKHNTIPQHNNFDQRDNSTEDYSKYYEEV